MADEFRTETDSLGEKRLPAHVYYGIQTHRALENFPISGMTLPPSMVRAMAVLKIAAARAHAHLGELDAEVASAIERAAREVLDGRLDDQFVVDVYQAGAGTSFHMNVNEVIANRASEMLGGVKGAYLHVHPNDHVNMGQSTNDVIPTAIRLAALMVLPDMREALSGLAEAFEERASAFEDVIKSGRTHLQDAVPVTLGQEFRAYARAVRHGLARLMAAAEPLKELGIGGSAAGTGMNTLPAYRGRVVSEVVQLTGIEVRPSDDLFYAMQSLAPFGDLSAAMRSLALELTRITNDIRLLASGPTTGLNEIRLPAVQPGSSIMPGKVNPSIPEMVNQVCFQVIGHDAAIAFAVQAGQLELNVMMPMVSHNLLMAMRIMTQATRVFDERCIRGIEANREVAEAFAMRSLGLATALNPIIGYRAAAEVVKAAQREGKTIPEIVVAQGLMSPAEAERFFSPANLTKPGKLSRPSREFVATEPEAPHWHAHHPATESVLPEELLDEADEDIPPP